ncbi:MAG: hypothetical protein JWR72_948 [Flavisolibacter sp.]|nr:hypothetical protein [Flavisolibacter sp.]
MNVDKGSGMTSLTVNLQSRIEIQNVQEWF